MKFKNPLKKFLAIFTAISFLISGNPLVCGATEYTGAYSNDPRNTYIGVEVPDGQDPPPAIASPSDPSEAGPLSTPTPSTTSTSNQTNLVTPDTVGPTGSININSGGSSYVSSLLVTLNLSATDSGSGVEKMTFSNDNVNWSTPENYATSKKHFLSGDGNKTVYVKYLDKLGNTSAVYSSSITLDVTYPTGSINIDPKTPNSTVVGSRTVTLNLAATDSGSGVEKMMFSPDRVNWSTPENYATSKTYTLSANTTTTQAVYVRYLDRAGNSSIAYSTLVKLDTTPPTGSIRFNQFLEIAGRNVAMDLYANDLGGSNPSRMSFSTNGTEWSSPEPYTTGKFILLPPGNSIRTVYVKYWDSVGNVSAVYSASSKIIIPFSAGRVTVNGAFYALNGDAPAINKSTVTLNLNVQNFGSDLSKMSFSSDNINWSTPENYATSKTYTLPAGNGNKTVYVKFLDQAGNTIAVDSTPIILDETQPTGSFNINNGAIYTTAQTVTLTLTATDTGSGVEKMMFSNDNVNWGTPINYATSTTHVLPAGDGNKTVYVKYLDKAGNTSAVYSNSITIDRTAPTGSININNGAANTTSRTVTLNLTATDNGSGVAKMSFSNDNVNWSTPENYATSKTYTLPAGDGSKTIYVKYLDREGNTSQSYLSPIRLDTTPPTGSISFNTVLVDLRGQRVAMDLVANDSAAGNITSMSFSTNGKEWSNPEPFSRQKYMILPSGNSRKTVYVKYWDSAGNVSAVYSASKMLNIPSSSGTVAVNGRAVALNGGVSLVNKSTVTLNLNAANLGPNLSLSKMSFSSDNINWSTPENYAASKAYTLPTGDGNKTVHVKYLDQAGNAIAVDSTSIMLDETQPTGSFKINSGTTHTASSTVTLNLTAADTGSGVVTMTFSNDNVNWSRPENYATSMTHNLPDGNGNKTVYVKYLDKAGNTSAVYSSSITLDTAHPTGSININPTGNIKISNDMAFTASQTVKLDLMATDNGSGVAKMSFSNDNVKWSTPENFATSKMHTLSAGDGEKMVYVKYLDKAGNTSQSYYTSFRLDSIRPTGSISFNTVLPISGQGVAMNLVANDATSYVESMSFSTNGTEWSSPEQFSTRKYMILPPGNGLKTVYVKYWDSAGNVSAVYSTSKTLNIPFPSEAVTVNGGVSVVNKTTVTLNLNAANIRPNLSLSKMSFSNDNVNWSTPENYATSKTYTLPSGDGNKTVYVKYLDQAGNTSAVDSISVMLDETQPMGSFNISNGAAYATSRAVTLNLTAMDTGSGIEKMMFSNDNVNWSWPENFATTKTHTLIYGDGNKTVYVKYLDKAGNTSAVYSSSITLDTTRPTGSIIIYNNNREDYTISQTVTLNLTAMDTGSGIAKMMFSNDESNWSTPENVAASKTYTLPPASRTVYVKYLDIAGNTSQPYQASINFPTVPPVNPTLPVNSNATVNSISVAGGVTTVNRPTITLNLSAVNSGSGLSQMSFSNDNINWSKPEPYATSKTHTLPTGDGRHTVYVKYLDTMGRSFYKGATTVYVDTTPPTGSINSDAYARPGSVMLNLAAWDGGRDVAKMMFSNDNVKWSTPENFATSHWYTLPYTDGSNGSTVYVKYLDKMGNMSIAYSKFITFDITPPMGRNYINSGSYTSSQTVRLSLPATDSESGVEKIMFSSDNRIWSKPENYSASNTFTFLPGDGIKTMYVRYLDKVGNASEAYTISTTLDETKPVGSININGGQHTLSPTVTLNLNGTDSLSGIARMSFSHDGRSWSSPEPYATTKTYTLSPFPDDGMHTISVRYYDHAGNVSDAYSKQILLDTLPPVVKVIKINDGERNIMQRSVSLNLWADDGGGLGVDKMSFSTDGETWTAPENYATTKAWNFPAEDGEQTVYVKVRDKSGKWSNGLARATVNLYTPIRTNQAININHRAEFTTSRDVTLNLSAPNVGSAIRSMSFSTNGGPWSDPEPYATSKNIVLPGGDGVKTVYVKYLDATGRWSSEFGATILMDINPPGSSYVRIIGSTSSEHYTGSRTVTLNLVGSARDAAEMMFSDDNVTWSTPEKFAPSKTHTLPFGDGMKTVYVKYLDRAGNVSPVFSNRIVLDQTPPIGSVTIGGGGGYVESRSRKVTLNLSAWDGGPGADDIRVSFLTDEDDAKWSIPEQFSKQKEIVLPRLEGDKKRTIKVKYTDSFGNESIIYSQELTLRITPSAIFIPPKNPIIYSGPGCADVTCWEERWQ